MKRSRPLVWQPPGWRLVDRFLPGGGLPVVVFFAVTIGTLNLASLLSNPAAELGLAGAAALPQVGGARSTFGGAATPTAW
jgi:hypothetical protein